MGRTGASNRGRQSEAKKYFGSANKAKEKMYLQGKEELTHTQAGRPRWDEQFFKAALKDKDYRGVKY